MRIPFDLIAAVLCIDGIQQFLKQSPASVRPDVSPKIALAAWLGFLLFGWLANDLLVRWMEWRTRFGLRPQGPAGSRHPQVFYTWGSRLIQTVMVLLFVGLLFFLNWPLRMESWPSWFGFSEQAALGRLPLIHSSLASMILNLGPFVAAMILSWLPRRRRMMSGLRHRPVPLGAFLANEIRMTFLPLCLWLILAAGGDIIQMLPPGLPSGPGVDLLVLLLILGLSTFIALPQLVIWLWGCQPLADGELKTRLQALMTASGVKARAILQWGPRNSNLLNACVLGPWARYRYVLLSPQLVDELGQQETEAVLAHELGHARYGHLQLLFVLLLCMSALWMWISQRLENINGPISPVLETCLIIAFVTLYIWGFFGSIMRQCEREADLASAEIMGTPTPIITALERLATIHGESRAVYTWHHGSIAQRVAAVQELSADPKLAARLHRRLRVVRWLLIALTALVLCAVFLPDQIGRP